MVIVYQDNAIFCLSTDTKPTTGVKTNSILYETDTGLQYYWNGTAWTATIPSSAYNFDTIVYKDATKTYAASKTGSILSSGTSGSTSDDTVINAAITNTPANGTLLIMPGTYIVGANVSELVTADDLTIMAYGVTIQSSSTSRTGAKMFKVIAGKSLSIYGMTIDCNKLYGNAVAADLTVNPKLIRFVDGKILNIYSYGLNPGGSDAVDGGDITLDVRNCYFDAGATDSLNEAIMCRSVKNTIVDSCEFHINKPFYIASNMISLNDVYMSTEKSFGSATYYTEGVASTIQGYDIQVKNLTSAGNGIECRAYGPVHYGSGGTVIYGPCRRLSIDGFTTKKNVADFQGLLIAGFNDSNGIETVTLKNLNIYRGIIKIQPFAQSDQTTVHSYIRKFTLEDEHLGSFDGNNAIVWLENTDIDLLVMKNIKTPTWAASRGPIRVFANGQNIATTLIDMDNIMPLSAGTIISVSDNSTAKTVALNIKQPMLKNLKTITTISGTVVITTKFYANVGTATVASGSTSVAVTHLLAYTPTVDEIQVTATNNLGSAAKFWVSAVSSTTFTISVNVDPGATTATFAWRAGNV